MIVSSFFKILVLLLVVQDKELIQCTKLQKQQRFCYSRYEKKCVSNYERCLKTGPSFEGSFLLHALNWTDEERSDACVPVLERTNCIEEVLKQCKIIKYKETRMAIRRIIRFCDMDKQELPPFQPCLQMVDSELLTCAEEFRTGDSTKTSVCCSRKKFYECYNSTMDQYCNDQDYTTDVRLYIENIVFGPDYEVSCRSFDWTECSSGYKSRISTFAMNVSLLISILRTLYYLA